MRVVEPFASKMAITNRLPINKYIQLYSNKHANLSLTELVNRAEQYYTEMMLTSEECLQIARDTKM